jgi:ABC-type nitrate/sulfonate/bicarbonate transport system substrate-binding protein
MQEGADAGWLYFYNFEGIEAQHEGMDVRYLDAQNAGFANFSALDLFVNRTFFDNNPEACSSFVTAVKEATELITNDPADALSLYYEYTGENASPLMNDIIKATIPCFDKDFESVAEKSVPILEFFREIGITSLDNERFKSAFLY